MTARQEEEQDSQRELRDSLYADEEEERRYLEEMMREGEGDGPDDDEEAAMLEAEVGIGDGEEDDEVMQSVQDDVLELMRQGRGGPDEEGPDEDEEDAMMRAFDEGARQEPLRPPAAPEAPGDPPRSRTRNVVYTEALQ